MALNHKTAGLALGLPLDLWSRCWQTCQVPDKAVAESIDPGIHLRVNSLLVRHARFAGNGGHDERRGDSRHSVKSEQVAVLSVRNGRVCQIASHVAVSPSKAAHSVQRVADADVQAGTQPKIVAHVMQRSALIAMLKGVERHDGRVRLRLRWCHTCAVGPGGLMVSIPCMRYAS